MNLLCRYLREHARSIAGKSQLFMNAYAKALEVIPRQLCDNAGFDSTDILNRLRQKHGDAYVQQPRARTRTRTHHSSSPPPAFLSGPMARTTSRLGSHVLNENAT
ncbi:MAG: hypothetical protein EOO38_18360 [Cytophagaceae bacterium]|nr:MAG: hypothetical protein EOO38_18360 [Cytophagaceae bacterium]